MDFLNLSSPYDINRTFITITKNLKHKESILLKKYTIPLLDINNIHIADLWEKKIKGLRDRLRTYIQQHKGFSLVMNTGTNQVTGAVEVSFYIQKKSESLVITTKKYKEYLFDLIN